MKIQHLIDYEFFKSNIKKICILFDWKLGFILSSNFMVHFYFFNIYFITTKCEVMLME